MASYTPENPPMVVDSSYQAFASCDKANHFHQWPIAGELEIERCEHYCLYCRGPKAHKKWSSAWFLRRHVRETHAKTEFPDLTVSEGWSKRPTGNSRPIFKKQRAPGSNRKRAGTKKDREAMVKAVGQLDDFDWQPPSRPHKHASITTQQPFTAGPTAVVDPVFGSYSPVQSQLPAHNAFAGHIPCQSVAPSPYMTDMFMSVGNADQRFHDQNGAASDTNLPSSINPDVLELFPALANSNVTKHTSAVEESSINFDDYFNSKDYFNDSALGTSIASDASVDGDVNPDVSTEKVKDASSSTTSATSLSDFEFDLGVKLTNSIWDAPKTEAQTTLDTSDIHKKADEFSDLFAGAQFDNFDFNSFALDPMLDTSFLDNA